MARPWLMLDPDGIIRPHLIDLMQEVWRLIAAVQKEYGCGVTEVCMRERR